MDTMDTTAPSVARAVLRARLLAARVALRGPLCEVRLHPAVRILAAGNPADLAAGDLAAPALWPPAVRAVRS